MDKFEKKKQEALERYRREIEALEKKEADEREKKVSPTVSKLTASMERVSRKFLEDNIELIEGFSFKKAEVDAAIQDVMTRLFQKRKEEENKRETESGSAMDVAQMMTSSGDIPGHAAGGGN